MSEATNFSSWIQKQTNRKDVVGDFARDVRRDHKAPSNDATKDSWLSHLIHSGASREAINAFEGAWAEYKA